MSLDRAMSAADDRGRQAVAFWAMASEPDPNSADGDHFEVIVPLRTRYASTVRMIAASLGAEAGFTVDEIDDLRLALDEVFSLLAERHVGDRVRTRFRLDGHQLVAGLTLESGSVDVEPDELATNILRSVVDEYEFTNSGVTLTKRASET
jgi:serine/threonine-protein kinase RsbW